MDDRYFGAKASDPATDNDGDALTAGDLYFNTVDNKLKVYTGSAWAVATANVAIADADDGGDYRHLHLYENLTTTFEFTLTSTFYKVKTSDGVIYDELGPIIHTWDSEQDINDTYRWVIIYKNGNGSPFSDKEAVGYACKEAIAGGYTASSYFKYFHNWHNLETCILAANHFKVYLD